MNESELIFTELLNCSRSDLYLNRDLRLDKKTASGISEALKRRIKGEPVQYILGKTEFMGLEFRVDENVLIPRPETEILVEVAIKIVKSRKSKVESILDLGTGSGCIAISLAKFLSDMHITGVDISGSAIEIAKDNARLNNVEDRVDFMISNLFSAFDFKPSTFNLIVSNPPYIPTTEIAKLQLEVQYEPRIVLDGGKDGLNFYRRIISQASKYLRPEGLLIMEMGFNQAEAIKNIFAFYKELKIIEIVKDYNNIDRVVVARKNG